MNTRLIRGTETADTDALLQMQMLARPGTKWAAYQNMDLGHSHLGHLRFLATGPGHTFPVPPERHPDIPEEVPLWRYRLVGFVNLKTGEIESV